MKKFLVLVALIMAISMGLNAQESKSHLCFKGVPITGKATNVIKKLQASGYTFKEKDDNNNILMTGMFANEKCEIYIYTTAISKEVYQIGVGFNEKLNWKSLKADYLKFKKQLNEKYDLLSSIERFSKPYYDGGGYELTALKLGKGMYASQFKVDNGSIFLAIQGSRVYLLYTDKNGDLINDKESKDLISKDL